MLLLLFAVSVAAFALITASPIDPLKANVGQAALGSMSQEQIAKLIAEAKIDVATVQEKCTVVTVTLKSGFILSESSACVDKANYNEEIGARCCMERIEKKLWELEGYALQKKLAECEQSM